MKKDLSYPQLFTVGAGLAVTLFSLALAWPVLRSTMAFASAQEDQDQAAMCQHALASAQAWSELGSLTKYREWEGRADEPCALAALRDARMREQGSRSGRP